MQDRFGRPRKLPHHPDDQRFETGRARSMSCRTISAQRFPLHRTPCAVYLICYLPRVNDNQAWSRYHRDHSNRSYCSLSQFYRSNNIDFTPVSFPILHLSHSRFYTSFIPCFTPCCFLRFTLSEVSEADLGTDRALSCCNWPIAAKSRITHKSNPISKPRHYQFGRSANLD